MIPVVLLADMVHLKTRLDFDAPKLGNMSRPGAMGLGACRERCR